MDGPNQRNPTTQVELVDSSGRHARLSSHWLNIEDSHLGETDNMEERDRERAEEGRTNMTTLSDRKKEFRIIAFILTPAIITTFVFLGLYWKEEGNCGPLRLWCLMEAFRLLMSISLSWVLQRDVERTVEQIHALDRFGSFVSMFSFFWFLLGHFWLLQFATTCSEAAPHLFHLMVALIVLQYTLMLLPLIVLLLLTPFLCLCLPCLLQGYFIFQKSQVKGASKREINKLPTIKYSRDEFAQRGYDDECSICITDFEEAENVRVLRCNHVFHKDCVDSWLTLNGTCPICRNEISKKPVRGPSPSNTGDSHSISLTSNTSSISTEGASLHDIHVEEEQEEEQEENVGAAGSSRHNETDGTPLSPNEESAEPTTGERLSATGTLWRRMLSFRTMFARRRAQSLRRPSHDTSGMFAARRTSDADQVILSGARPAENSNDRNHFAVQTV